MTRSSPHRPRLVVAGASGFIGRGLPEAVGDHYDLIGLSRTPQYAAINSPTAYRWRRCDLFSRAQTFEALRGADAAVYLVHSMMPSADLSQGSFADMDVICADNFARAAAHHDVEHIVYVSTLFPLNVVPDRGSTPKFPEKFGPHRATRRRGEIEYVLQSYGTPVTTLRAGFVIGPGGAATDMLFRLVERLPVMLLPRWTSSKVSPIARSDLVELVSFALTHRDQCTGTFEVGGAGITTYRLMLALVADVLGLQRRMFRLPVASPTLSSHWISTVTGQPHSIVWPLVERFRHDLVPQNRSLQKMARQQPLSTRTALEHAHASQEPDREIAPPIPATDDDRALIEAPDVNVVRSVHRLTLPSGRTTRWIAAEYARWLPQFLSPLIGTTVEGDFLYFHLRPMNWPLLTLVLDHEVSRTDRQLFWIRGGLLSAYHPQARLEFRRIPDRPAVLTAIHHYRPRLPWWLYLLTQAPFHHLVMRAFDRHLRHLDTQHSSR